MTFSLVPLLAIGQIILLCIAGLALLLFGLWYLGRWFQYEDQKN